MTTPQHWKEGYNAFVEFIRKFGEFPETVVLLIEKYIEQVISSTRTDLLREMLEEVGEEEYFSKEELGIKPRAKDYEQIGRNSERNRFRTFITARLKE